MITIIIPIYNVAPYIEQCLTSVAEQTYQGDIECILVDDCGTDNSIEICEQYVANYKGQVRFKILHHTQNRGLSASRNTGIKNSTGEYLMFLDSDDTISLDCLSIMSEHMESDENVDMVLGDFKTIGKEYGWKFAASGIYDGNFIEMACSYKMYTMAVNRLIRRNFILNNKLFFEEGLLHEDELWNIQIACYLKKAVFIKEKTYNYLIHEGTIHTNPSQEFHFRHYVDVKTKMIDFIIENGFGNNQTLYRFCTSDLYKYMCQPIVNGRKYLAKEFYIKFRKVHYWSIFQQKRLGAGKADLLLALNRYLPKCIGLQYYYCISILLSKIYKLRSSFF